MKVDNIFFLLGQTDVGKSTLIKISYEDTSIKIRDSINIETKELINYKCSFGDFNYILIDIPG